MPPIPITAAVCYAYATHRIAAMLANEFFDEAAPGPPQVRRDATGSLTHVEFHLSPLEPETPAQKDLLG